MDVEKSMGVCGRLDAPVSTPLSKMLEVLQRYVDEIGRATPEWPAVDMDIRVRNEGGTRNINLLVYEK